MGGDMRGERAMYEVRVYSKLVDILKNKNDSSEKAIVYYNGKEFVFETLSEALMFIEEEDI